MALEQRLIIVSDPEAIDGIGHLSKKKELNTARKQYLQTMMQTIEINEAANGITVQYVRSKEALKVSGPKKEIDRLITIVEANQALDWKKARKPTKSAGADTPDNWKNYELYVPNNAKTNNELATMMARVRQALTESAVQALSSGQGGNVLFIRTNLSPEEIRALCANKVRDLIGDVQLIPTRKKMRKTAKCEELT